MRMRQMKRTGFYVIKDQFFKDMSDPYLKSNKEGNRPHYYCLEDASAGMYWMIPLSSRIDKYKQIMEKKLEKHVILYISSNWTITGKARF